MFQQNEKMTQQFMADVLAGLTVKPYEMDKYDLLFIRGCKSKNPYERLPSIHRRFYLMPWGYDSTEFLVRKLGEICEKYELISITKLVEELSPCFNWKYEMIPVDRRLYILTNAIRQAPITKFRGYKRPARFRK